MEELLTSAAFTSRRWSIPGFRVKSQYGKSIPTNGNRKIDMADSLGSSLSPSKEFSDSLRVENTLRSRKKSMEEIHPVCHPIPFPRERASFLVFGCKLFKGSVLSRLKGWLRSWCPWYRRRRHSFWDQSWTGPIGLRMSLPVKARGSRLKEFEVPVLLLSVAVGFSLLLDLQSPRVDSSVPELIEKRDRPNIN